MRKLLVLMGLSMLGAMMFGSVAGAQESSGASVSGCTTASASASASASGPTKVVTCVDFASPTASPSATSSATATAGATSSASASASAAGAAQYQYTSASALPGTGGISPVTLLGIIPAILLIGGGLLSARLIRRS